MTNLDPLFRAAREYLAAQDVGLERALFPDIDQQPKLAQAVLLVRGEEWRLREQKRKEEQQDKDVRQDLKNKLKGL